METLTRLNREQGVTIIVVTHEADIAAYADRVVTMRDGQIVSDERKPKPAPVAETPRGATGAPVARPQRTVAALASRTHCRLGLRR